MGAGGTAETVSSDQLAENVRKGSTQRVNRPFFTLTWKTAFDRRLRYVKNEKVDRQLWKIFLLLVSRNGNHGLCSFAEKMVEIEIISKVSADFVGEIKKKNNF